MLFHKEKSYQCLGNALKNDIENFFKKKTSGYLNTQKEPKSKKLESLTHEKSLDAFLSAINLSETRLITERNNIKTIEKPHENIHLLSSDQEKELLKTHQQLKSNLVIPRRPYWNSETTPEELERNEKQAFFDWRRKLASLQENHDLFLTPFERNIEVWRQLWRVIEKCHLIVQIVDARNPLLFRCKDLERYVNEMNKKNFLLINKADLMTIKQRKYWADYFEMKGINYTFFSAMSEKSIEENHINTRVNDILENIRDEVENSSDINKEYPIKDHQNISGNKLQIEKEDNILEEERTRIITVDELKNVLIKEIQLMSNNRDNFNTEKIEKFYVGLVGYPNVGKSSTINSLAGGKKVSVSATPGRTKHFQTIHITDKLVLCDCPGLVFPNFSTTRTELVCNGVLPIDQLQDYISPIALILRRIPKHIFESIYGVSIQIESSEKDEAGILTAEQFLTEYLVHRGIDKSRASRHIIKDYVNGKLLFCNPPPGIDPFTFNSEYYDSFKLFTDKHSKTNSFIKNEVFNMISKNAKKQKSFKTEELQNNKLLIFDKNFFYQNKSFLESNQKIIKSFCYKKYTGPNPTHSSEYHLRNNVLSKSKKHFKSYKRKNHHIFGIE